MDRFLPVKSGKISELIALQIKNAILNGAMRPGDRLPPERELVDRFQVSRISVREALKNLEAFGLLTIKPGSGVFVAETNLESLSESLSSMLRIQKSSIQELSEARSILEPYVAVLASKRITPEELQGLEQNIHQASMLIESASSARIKNIEFHCLIAEATHNPVLALTMKTMFNVWKEWSLEIREKVQKKIDSSIHAMEYHKKILRALREKDPEKVQELMVKHTLQVQEDFRGRLHKK